MFLVYFFSTFMVVLIVGLFMGGISIFFQNIVVFDCLAISAISGYYIHKFLNIHSAFCLLIGIAIFFLLAFLQNTRIGFALICLTSSISWASGFALLALAFSSDWIWFGVVFGLVFLGLIFLHAVAKHSSEDS